MERNTTQLKDEHRQCALTAQEGSFFCQAKFHRQGTIVLSPRPTYTLVCSETFRSENKNYLHMMERSDLDTLFENQNVQNIEKRAAGVFSLAGEEDLSHTKAVPELWRDRVPDSCFVT